MKKIKTMLKIGIVLPLAIFLVSCNPIENETKSGSMLIVDSISGVDINGNSSNFLQSDVLYQDEDSVTIFADIATARIRVELLDPFSVTGPSQYNAVTIERYVVSYMRTDGRNAQGVDVPYSFEGSLSVTISVGQTVGFSFVIVREVAKIEPPLVNLAEGRDVGVLQVAAKIEFYGRDQANREVKAVGYLPIFFANYANE